MIYLDSRYADGLIFKSWDAHRQAYHRTVFRQWPSYYTDYFVYEWVQGDRLDNISNKFLGSPEYWWQIMDINPELTDPTTITPGTQLRIPNA